MVTDDGPDLVLQQVKASDRRKRSINPELLVRFQQQDLRVFDLLLRYRAEESVAEALVAELLPAVEAKAGRMSPIGLYGRGDLRQELIAEVMYVACRLPLKRPNFVTRRLMLAAAKRLARRLEREWYQRLDDWYGRLDHVSAVTTEEDSAEGEE